MASAAWRNVALILLVACGGERAPGNDTVTVEEPPPDDSTAAPNVSTWNRSAGQFFAIRSDSGAQAIVVNPAYGDAQALDTLTAAEWNVEGSALSLFDGAQLIASGQVTGLHYDSTCAGWPTATLTADPASSAAWRVAFPANAVDVVTFDSIAVLTATDSADRTRAGALAASKLADDTVAAFRGRPFIIRQANRLVAGDTVYTMFEVVRLVAQEANPLQEQLLILTEEGPGREPTSVFHAREVREEEKMGSIELLAALRVKRGGRLALLVRRERENGFVLEWIERSPRGTWFVRWRSATDSC